MTLTAATDSCWLLANGDRPETSCDIDHARSKSTAHGHHYEIPAFAAHVLGAITDPGVIARILKHMGLDGRLQARAPPSPVTS
jgi:hypothetical protein